MHMQQAQSQHKPRFNRSAPTVITAADLKKSYIGNKGNHNPKQSTSRRTLASDEGVHWRKISMKTLGFLAAKGKISIVQVHSLMGDKSNKAFRDSFLANVDIRKPTPKDMTQIGLFSHLLF